jgi:biopolymer transport protein ExbD
MAGTTQGDEEDIISGINVTPMVDIVLVLLIIFIVTASFLLRSSIPIQLPAGASSEASAAGLMVVGIRKDGQLFVNGRLATLDDLPAAVADAKKRRADPTKPLNVFVSADVAADYGAFAAVVDRLRLEGVTDVSMDTRPVSGVGQPEPAAGPGGPPAGVAPPEPPAPGAGPPEPPAPAAAPTEPGR